MKNRLIMTYFGNIIFCKSSNFFGYLYFVIATLLYFKRTKYVFYFYDKSSINDDIYQIFGKANQ